MTKFARALLAVTFLCSCAAALQQSKRIQGSCDNEHGALMWFSDVRTSRTVERSWEYEVKIENNDDALCRVKWDVVWAKTTLNGEGKKGDTYHVKTTAGFVPQRRDGKIYYNGRNGVGGGVSPAQAWVANETTAAARISTAIKLSVECEGIVYPLSITAESENDARRAATYRLQMTAIGDEAISGLLDVCRVEWRSVEPLVWKSAIFRSGRVEESAIEFKPSDDRRSAAFEAMLKTDKPLKYRSGAIVFLDGDDVVASASAPAFSFANK